MLRDPLPFCSRFCQRDYYWTQVHICASDLHRIFPHRGRGHAFLGGHFVCHWWLQNIQEAENGEKARTAVAPGKRTSYPEGLNTGNSHYSSKFSITDLEVKIRT